MLGFVIGILGFFILSVIVVGASLWLVFREKIRGCIHQDVLWERAQSTRMQPLNGDFPRLIDTMFIGAAAHESLVQNPSIDDMRSWAPKLPELQMHELMDAPDMEAVNYFQPAFSALTSYENVQSQYENLMRRVAVPPKYAGVDG